VSEVARVINRIGMYRQKSKNIVGLAQQIVEAHGGRVPSSMAELVRLPGVGRKTANVVLGVAFGRAEGIVVDTHVARLAQRLGWTNQSDPVKIENDLMGLFPRGSWDAMGHTLIFHGRRVCRAARPACSTCAVNDACPSAFIAENVGRKPRRSRGMPHEMGV
jgi:endonuclease-3